MNYKIWLARLLAVGFGIIFFFGLSQLYLNDSHYLAIPIMLMGLFVGFTFVDPNFPRLYGRTYRVIQAGCYITSPMVAASLVNALNNPHNGLVIVYVLVIASVLCGYFVTTFLMDTN